MKFSQSNPELIHLATLNLWEKTNGTWIDVMAIVLGTALGLLLQGNLPQRMMRIITQGVGLLTLFLGVTMAGSLLKVQVARIDGVIIGLIAIVVGGLLGEWLRIEERLAAIGNALKRVFRGRGSFTEGFVTASLLFCVGPLSIIGSLNNGLTGNNAVLSVKAAIDGFVSIALASSYGIGVGFSSLALLIYQGGLSIAAGEFAQHLPDPATAPSVLLTSGVGGLMIVGLGLNLLEITKLSIASFLPALIATPLLYTIVERLI
jgi:uncharacterized protein